MLSPGKHREETLEHLRLLAGMGRYFLSCGGGRAGPPEMGHGMGLEQVDGGHGS